MRKRMMPVMAVMLTAAVLTGCAGSTPQTSEEPPSKGSSAESIVSSAQDSTEESSSAEEEEPFAIPHPEQKYFYQTLSTEEKPLFERMYKTVLSFGKQADFSEPVPSETLDKLMWYLNYDCPELIHLKGEYAPIYQSSHETTVSGVCFFYNMEQKDYDAKYAEVEEVLSALRKAVGEKSDYEKEKYVYDMIFENCIYQDTEGMTGSVYGALVEHKARCEGISKAVALCLRALDIECLTVVGQPQWEADAVYQSHSWNIVRIGGAYYHLDLTTDNMKTDSDSSQPPLYGFLNVTDECIFETRTADSFFADAGLPVCTEDKYNYHKMNGQLIEAGSDVPKRFEEILDQKFRKDQENRISIRIESEDDYRKYLDQWTELLAEYIKTKGYRTVRDTVYYNDVSNTIVIAADPDPEPSEDSGERPASSEGSVS